MAQMSGRLLTSAMVVWLLGATAAHAGFTDWSYAWGNSPIAVAANGGAGAGAIDFTLPQPSAVNSPISPVALSSTTAPTGSDVYNADAYSLTFSVTDNGVGGAPKVLTLSGQFDGSVDSASTTLDNTFTNGSGTQTIKNYNGHDYLVTFGYSAPPNPAATASWKASLTASVTVTDSVTTAPNPSSTPEPTSLLLAGLSLPAFSLAGWKRWVRKPSLPSSVAA